jgi:hypothetical protein
MHNRAIVTVTASVLAALSLVLAGPASADGAHGPNEVRAHHPQTHSVTAPVPVDPPVGTDPSGTTPGQELPDPDPPGSTPGDDVADPDPYTEAGHDKCKKRKHRPLPQWCFGLSSWPLYKVEPIRVIPAGICDASSVHPSSRCRHSAGQGPTA